MNFLRNILKQSGKLFEEGKPLSWAYPVWEATDTILFSTDKQTSSGPHISCLLYTSPSPRDGLLSRMPSSA